MFKINLVRQFCLIGLMSSAALLSAIDSTTHISPVAQQKKESERTFLQKIRESTFVFSTGAGAIAGIALSIPFCLNENYYGNYYGNPLSRDEVIVLSSIITLCGTVAGMSAALTYTVLSSIEQRLKKTGHQDVVSA